MSNPRVDALESAERWLETAREEVASIRAWRGVDYNEVMHRYWSTLQRNPHDDAPTMPKCFNSDTCALVALMADEFGNLSTTPILQVYDAVFRWHKHRRADRRLRQSVLESKLERAAISIAAIRRAILKDVRPGKTAGGEARKRRPGEWLALAMLTIREHPEWSDRQVAKEIGVNHSTLSRSKEFQAAAVLARGQRHDYETRGYIEDADGERRIEAVAKPG